MLASSAALFFFSSCVRVRVCVRVLKPSPCSFRCSSIQFSFLPLSYKRDPWGVATIEIWRLYLIWRRIKQCLVHQCPGKYYGIKGRGYCFTLLCIYAAIIREIWYDKFVRHRYWLEWIHYRWDYGFMNEKKRITIFPITVITDLYASYFNCKFQP